MILATVLRLCQKVGFSYYHKLSHKCYVRHLLVRKAVKTGEILINLITSSQEEEGVEAAKENAALNGLTNCHFIVGDVLKMIDELTDKPDIIVLDPPRDGIHPKALDKIIEFGVDRIVYISCKPTSLARRKKRAGKISFKTF